MNLRKHTVCFVDDDPEEIRRFRDNLDCEFVIAAGTSIDEALTELRKKGRKKPDLFILDLYFPEGGRNTEEEVSKIHSARVAFLKAQVKFLTVLAQCRQAPHGGLELARDLDNEFGSIAYIFFTRKGMLEDANRAFKYGALKIIKKPDPNESEMEDRSISDAYDIAFKNNAGQIAQEIKDAIKISTWWWRNKKTVIGFLIGVLSSLIGGITLIILS